MAPYWFISKPFWHFKRICTQFIWRCLWMCYGMPFSHISTKLKNKTTYCHPCDKLLPSELSFIKIAALTEDYIQHMDHGLQIFPILMFFYPSFGSIYCTSDPITLIITIFSSFGSTHQHLSMVIHRNGHKALHNGSCWIGSAALVVVHHSVVHRLGKKLRLPFPTSSGSWPVQRGGGTRRISTQPMTACLPKEAGKGNPNSVSDWCAVSIGGPWHSTDEGEWASRRRRVC